MTQHLPEEKGKSGEGGAKLGCKSVGRRKRKKEKTKKEANEDE